MSRRTNTRKQQRLAKRLARKDAGAWQVVDLDGVPSYALPCGLCQAWTNNHLSAQLYQDFGQRWMRLSVRRHDEGGVSWDELQRAKNELLGSSALAVEIYPPEDEVVNVANMRHLWIKPVGEKFDVGWRKDAT